MYLCCCPTEPMRRLFGLQSFNLSPRASIEDPLNAVEFLADRLYPTEPMRRLFGLQRFRRSPRASVSIQESLNAVEFPKEELTFEENMERRRLSEAAEQLIAREERLFGEIAETCSQDLRGDEITRLAEDRTAFISMVEQALNVSFNSETEGVEVLKSAVNAIRQEEEQDRKWQDGDRIPPAWRPSRMMREIHDAALQKLVEERMDAASISGDTERQSSIQRELCGYGKQTRQDLLKVVTVVKDCYPAELDICNLYAQLFHRAFSSRLRNIANFALDEPDCAQLLRWINGYYPGILTGEALAGHIDYERLGQLLPEDLYEPLEKQYLSNKKEEVWRYLQRCLDAEEEAWRKGAEPEKVDGCFFSPLAIDVVQCVNGAVRSTECILGDQCKAEAIVCLLRKFLDNLLCFQTAVMRKSGRNSTPIVKAYLACLEQFREFIVKKAHLFPSDVKQSCLCAVTSMKKSAHTYLFKPVHKALKPHFRAVGTSEYLKKPLFEDLLECISAQLVDLQGLSDPCQQELIGQLQVEVTAEYVRRLLKGKLRLKNKQRQEEAARTISDNAQEMAKLFSGAGSRESWLEDILSKIAEVLRLQDLPSIQIEVVSMGTTYPDLSSRHVSALLKLKSTLSRSDRHMVKDVLEDYRRDGLSSTSYQPARFFFFGVNVK